MCYVHNQRYDISCATLYVLSAEEKLDGRNKEGHERKKPK